MTPPPYHRYFTRFAGLAKALAVFGASRLIVLMGFVFSINYLKPNPTPNPWNLPFPWLRFFLRFDSAYYLDIAANGYRYNGNPLQMQSIVFFPGYPMLIAGLPPILHISLPGSAILVSNLCASAAVALLFVLVARLWDEDVAILTVAALSLFPASLFLSAAYSEGAALLLTIAAFALAFRGRLLLAALCAGCLSATRPLGFLLSIPLIYDVWRNHGRRLSPRFLGAAAAIGVTAVSGLIAFALYCWLRFNDPLVFIHARAAWNIEGGGLPSGQVAWRQLTSDPALHFLPNLSDAYFFLLFLALALALWKRLPMEFNLYTAASFLALLATRVFRQQGFASMNRYLMLVFPCLIGLALLAVRRAWLMVLTGAFFGALLFIYSAFFAQWYWAG